MEPRITKRKNSKKTPQKPEPKNGKNFFIWLLIFLGVIYMFRMMPAAFEAPIKKLTYGDFYEMVRTNDATGSIASAVKMETIVKGAFIDGATFIVNVPMDDPELLKLLRIKVKDFDIRPAKTVWMNLFISFGPLLLFIIFLWYMYRGAAQGGSRIWSFGKSKAKQLTNDRKKVTFNDVAGVDEAKEELIEVIEFLKDPKKFQKLGGKMPKGVLLLGPPGCGKTLLAKAVAGEAEVPFFSISGSDFVEMFVGVGASRVRDLFDQAKRSAKTLQKGCIIFIDEIDAVGRQRFAGIGGGHDEREQTLNALLVEMDGFDTQEGVVLIAATNRPDVLDPALLRPGRFDRNIIVGRPDIVGREEILKVHIKNIKIDPNIDLRTVAKQTPGFSGADIANLVNEAAVLAARKNKKMVEIDDLQASIERVIAGPEKKAKVISKEEKEITAYHESGHALLSLMIPFADPLHKVSILPRGMALGYTLTPPTEDRHIYTKKKLMAEIAVILGGRASEEMIFKELSSGAQADLKAVTEKARKMVTRLGMSEKLGHLTFGRSHENVFLGRDLGEERDYSDETARIIDQEVRKIIDSCYSIATETLSKNIENLKLLANTLLEKEVMYEDEVKKLLTIAVEKKTNDSPSKRNKKST